MVFKAIAQPYKEIKNMAEKNFKIAAGLEFPVSGVLTSNAMLGGALQYNNNNVATEFFVNNALSNINVAQFIDSVAFGSPLAVNNGQLSLNLDAGGLSITTKNIGGSNALVVNPYLTGMDYIAFNGGLLSLSNTGAITAGAISGTSISSANIQATGYIDLGAGNGISTNPDAPSTSFYISNTGNIERAGQITTSHLYLIAPNSNTSAAYFRAQTDSDLSLSGGTLNTENLKVGYDAFGATGAGTLTVAGNTTIHGDLTVNGTTTTINTQNLLVEDNMVTLNSNILPGNAAAAVSSGIEVLRGDSPTARLYWDEMSPGWYINNGNTTSQLGASYISSVDANAFTVTSGELNLSVGNGLMLDTAMGTGLTIDPADAVYTASQAANVYSESATMAVYLDTANVSATIGTFAPAVTPRGTAAELRSFEAHVTLVTPSGATRTSKLVGVNNNGTIDYNEYAIVEGVTSGFGADITVVDGTANGGQITIEATHGIAGTLAIAHWTAISN
jgi:hypothetical protein